MKIRTIEELQDKLDSDFAWRRKELTEIYRRVQKAKSHLVNTELRVGVVMLYAHWEGFIKNITQYYVTYVCQRRLNFNDLKNNFIAMELQSILEKRDKSLDKNTHTLAVEFIRSGLTKRSNIKHQIDTKSNLNSDVLQDILLQVGIDYSKYVTKEKLIDERLLNNRNTIAHGNYLILDQDDYNVLFKEIIEIMSDLKNRIANHAIQKKYIN